ncbi:hypothetical protein RRG08_064941, partial [Elysia crispata]
SATRPHTATDVQEKTPCSVHRRTACSSCANDHVTGCQCIDSCAALTGRGSSVKQLYLREKSKMDQV